MTAPTHTPREAAAVARLREHRAVVFTPGERWYADAETAALLAQPDDRYAERLAATNDAYMRRLAAMPPLPEPLTDAQQLDDYLGWQRSSDPFLSTEGE